jgi:N-acetylglutamate synthase
MPVSTPQDHAMPTHHPALPAMLRLAIDAWPALETAECDGWLWRSSGGGSKRANSVATLAFTGGDLDTAIDAAIEEGERRYRARGQLVRFQVEEIGAPTGLTERLLGRGYALEETTVNMAKSIAPQAAALARGDGGCSVSNAPTLDWLAVYLSAITPDRRVINEEIVHGVPKPRAFILCRHEGAPISSGLCVASGDVAIVECMATAPGLRRSGGARRILAAIEAWAAAQGVTTLFLQVVEINAPAVALYAQTGFKPVALTRYFSRA